MKEEKKFFRSNFKKGLKTSYRLDAIGGAAKETYGVKLPTTTIKKIFIQKLPFQKKFFGVNREILI